jgi:hypothetical protein
VDTALLTAETLDAETQRTEAHSAQLINVGGSPWLSDRYAATCSCRQWSAAPARRTAVLGVFLRAAAHTVTVRAPPLVPRPP